MVNVSPNPTYGEFAVYTSVVVKSIIVTDELGKTVLKIQPTTNLTSIYLSEFSDGIYFITINAEEKSSTLKIIKQ